jgi:hypothetical protein
MAKAKSRKAKLRNDFSAKSLDIYSEAQLDGIFGTVKWRTDADQIEIRRKICSAAHWYGPYKQMLEDAPRPSELERQLRSFKKSLSASADALRNLTVNSNMFDAVESAGRWFAQHLGGLPDVPPDKFELEKRPGEAEPTFVTDWDVQKQFKVIESRLDWLIRCTDSALEHVRAEKAVHGSPKADDAIHSMIRMLHVVYIDFAANPRGPGADEGDGTSEAGTWRKSELLDFLGAAFAPLGITKSREAIYSDWRRATGGKLTPGKRWHQLIR